MTQAGQQPVQVDRLLHRVLLRPVEGAEALYFTSSSAGDDLPVRLEAGRAISFGSMANAFPASYWAKWTDVGEITLRVVSRGAGTLHVCRSNGAGVARKVNSLPLAQTASTATLNLAGMDAGGWFWFEIESTSEVEILEAGWWASSSAPTGSIAVVTTTMNKGRDVLATLQSLASSEVLHRVRHVVVVDHGSTPVEETPGFAQVATTLGQRLHVVPQANLGGSGGFSRGMLEALEIEGSDYVVLMDDDIVLEPESLERAATFADHRLIAGPVGAQMFYSAQPSRLHSMGEVVHPTLVIPRPASRVATGLDLAEHALPLTPELHRRVDVDYNGWWMTLIPTAVIQKIGLSLPLFIKWDDAEFGLRAKAHGFPTVTLPGAFVWHDDWSNKDDLVGWQAYFHARNRLVVAGLYGPRFPWQVFAESFMLDVRHLLALQYGTHAARVSGVEDLLRNQGDLMSELGSALGASRAALARFTDGRPQADTTLFPPLTGPDSPRAASAKPVGAGLVMWTVKTTARQLLTRVPGSARQAPAAQVPFSEARWWTLADFDSVLVEDAAGRSAWHRRSRRSLSAGLWRSLRAYGALCVRWGRLREELARALPDQTSVGSWAEFLQVKIK